MELRSYLREVWNYRYRIIFVVAITTVFMFAITSTMTKVYTAESRLVVRAGLGTEGRGTDDVLAAPRVGQTYAVLATTRPFLQEVIDLAVVPYTPEALLLQLTVTANLDTPFMVISVNDGNPERAARVANALAEVLIEKATIPPITTVGEEAPETRLLELVEPATVPDEPSAPRVLFSTAIGAAGSLLVALVAIAFAAYLRPDPWQQLASE